MEMANSYDVSFFLCVIVVILVIMEMANSASALLFESQQVVILVIMEMANSGAQNVGMVKVL